MHMDNDGQLQRWINGSQQSIICWKLSEIFLESVTIIKKSLEGGNNQPFPGIEWKTEFAP